MAMRAIAIPTYNEERFIAGCLENLIPHGLQVYPTDSTHAGARSEARRYTQAPAQGAMMRDVLEGYIHSDPHTDPPQRHVSNRTSVLSNEARE